MKLEQTASPTIHERPGSFDWESLADADAEYREWLEARHSNDVAALEAATHEIHANERDAA